MILPGSCTARGARYRCSPADSCRSRPVTCSVRVSRTAPAWETIPDPSADTVILERRAVFFTGKCLRLMTDRTLDKPHSPSSEATFSSKKDRERANPARKPEVNKCMPAGYRKYLATLIRSDDARSRYGVLFPGQVHGKRGRRCCERQQYRRPGTTRSGDPGRRRLRSLAGDDDSERIRSAIYLVVSVEEPGEGGAIAARVGVDRGDVVGSGDVQVGDQAGAGAGEDTGEGGGNDSVGAALDQQDRNA
jgi:hypothetical protein